MNTYRVRLDHFEGPLDLLLFFIQRDELDVYDIPIASITEEYLEYVRLMEQIDLDGVGDFLLVAAMLIQIKARMLLPTQEVDEDGAPVDPRAELVERLLEYIRYKEAAAGLGDRFDLRANLFTRPGASSDRASVVSDPDIIADGSVFDLVAALKGVLSRVPADATHDVESEVYSIEEQLAFVRSALVSVGRVSFVELVNRRSKPFIITTFLAILELAKQGDVKLLIDRGAEDFLIRRTDAAHDESEPGHGNGQTIPTTTNP